MLLLDTKPLSYTEMKSININLLARKYYHEILIVRKITKRKIRIKTVRF